METLTKEFFIEQIDSLRTEMATKTELASLRSDMEKEFDGIRTEMATKEDIESLVEMTSNAFTGMTERFVGLETEVATIDTKVGRLETTVTRIDTNLDTLLGFDHQHQIDVIRDDVRVVKTQLGIA